MAIELTEFQKEAVNNTGGTLLISAAAGSGKTQVLIDRMLKKVQSETEPCNIDDFLMITFTKAAASELRGKIIRRLNVLLSEQEPTAHLQAQLSRVYLAQISTIHSFCGSLLRDYAHQLDIPADFRVMEEAEAHTLSAKVMQDLLNEVYQEEDEEIFSTLDILGAGRDDGELPKIILRCNKAVCNCTNPKEKIAHFAKLLSVTHAEELAQCDWVNYLISEFHHDVRLLRQEISKALDVIYATAWMDKYIVNFEETQDLLDRYLSADTWDEIRTIPLEFSRLKSISKPQDPELKEKIAAVRTDVKESLKKWLSRFSTPSVQIVEDLCATAPPLRGLLRLTEEYGKRYSLEKKRKHLLDYNDLEQETLRLLYGKGKTPTAAAKEISQRYVELMIDEYQDTNSVQDAIFSAISKNGKNLFFVGDVKQSIYRFRGAEPEIFTQKYDDFADYKQVQDGQPRKILLSDNFRSSPAILSAANDVFRLNMNRRVGAVDYDVNVALRSGAPKPQLSYPAVELHCIDIDRKDLDPDVGKGDLEAHFVARRIAKILQEETLPEGDGQERKVLPRDIVILLRSLSSRGIRFQEALKRYGIPAVCSNENLFETEELRFLDALLRVIDNPHQDIPLLSVLLSSVVRLSPDVLAYVRKGRPNDDIYGSLRTYKPDLPFLKSLEELRLVAQQGSVRELMDVIEELFRLRACFSETQHTLDAFAQIVQQFESGGQYSLTAFLRYLDRLKDKGVETQTSAGNAVQITTIHKSKGLEYPIVFLCDLSKGFNYRDTYETVQIDQSFGLASKVYDPSERSIYPTAALTAIVQKTRREVLSEEMRLLYVAMTRPEHRLIMTYCNIGLEKKLNEVSGQITLPLSPMLIEKVGAMGDWILLTALTHTESKNICADPSPFAQDSPYPWHMELHHGVSMELEEQMQEDLLLEEEVLPLYEISYAHEKASLTASKLTATQLKGRAEDEELESVCHTVPRFDKPNFQSKPLSAAERGTAIHTAMQYMVYERCVTLEGIKGELERLSEEKYLSPQQVEAVSPNKILNFFRSSLGQRVLSAPKVIREFKFSILQDGANYNRELSGEHFLLQGVTDCCLIEDGMLTILDFKSDRISLGDLQERGEYYRGQIETYAQALSSIFRLPVKDKILYFFSIDQTYEL